MITVTDYIIRERKDGSKFTALVVEGSPEMVQSLNSGRFYLTIRKTTIPSTLDEDSAKRIIGTRLPGEIVRVKTDPYEYTNSTTNESYTLDFSWEYRQNSENTLEESFLTND